MYVSLYTHTTFIEVKITKIHVGFTISSGYPMSDRHLTDICDILQSFRGLTQVIMLALFMVIKGRNS